MAFGYTLKKRGVMGNRAYKIFDITDIQSTGSVVHVGFRKVTGVIPQNETSGAGMTVTMADANGEGATGRVTLTATNDQDGTIMVFGVGAK